MKVLWLTWKDKKNPRAGGAEFINESIAQRLVQDGHEVIFLVSGFKGGQPREVVDGYQVVRLGNRWFVYYLAYRYYQKNLKGWADLVIDEVNTIPFLAKLYVRERNILFVHQLCREIWFYEMAFPFNLLGYLLEPLYLRLLSDRQVITVSESSKRDLMRYGFREDRIAIIPEAIDLEPLEDLHQVHKYEHPTLLSLGTIRPMKRTHHIIRAFELAKQDIPELRLIVAGRAEGRYGKKVVNMIQRSRYASDIQYLGEVDRQTKTEILQSSHLLCVTSVKEGWGLIVTEAASQGTPAVVYDVDGLRDSVREGQAGWICKKNNPCVLASDLMQIIRDQQGYRRIQIKAFRYHKSYIDNNVYRSFIDSIKN